MTTLAGVTYYLDVNDNSAGVKQQIIFQFYIYILVGQKLCASHWPIPSHNLPLKANRYELCICLYMMIPNMKISFRFLFAEFRYRKL